MHRVEVRPAYYERYNRWMQGKMDGTAWVVSNNYYKSPSGRIVTQWPYGALVYGVMAKVLGPPSEYGRVAVRQPAPEPVPIG